MNLSAADNSKKNGTKKNENQNQAAAAADDKDEEQRDDLHDLYTFLKQALEQEQGFPVATFVAIISLHPQVLQRQDSHGRTLLYIACEHCCCQPNNNVEAIVPYLVQMCPSSVRVVNVQQQSNTPLHVLLFSCPTASLDCVEVLTRHYYNYHPSMAFSLPLQNALGWTPLHIACSYNTTSPTVLDHLLEKQPVSCLVSKSNANPFSSSTTIITTATTTASSLSSSSSPILHLPLDEAVNSHVSPSLLQRLRQAMSEAAHALVEVSLHPQATVPWRVSAHIAVTLGDRLSVAEQQSGKNDGNDEPRSSTRGRRFQVQLVYKDNGLDEAIVRQLLQPDYIQACLYQVPHQRLLDGIIKLHRARRRYQDISERMTDSTQRLSSTMMIACLSAVSRNVQALYWQLRQSPSLCQRRC